MAESVAVHFKQKFPIFPLPETVLLPHAVMPLTIFEPRYRAMTNKALDGSGQIAIATYEQSPQQDKGAIREVVCLSQIVQHEKVQHGYNILMYGLCRAKVEEEYSSNDDCPYRKAKLRPLEKQEVEVDESYRAELLHMLRRPNLQRLENYESIVSWAAEPTLSNSAIFELIGCSVFDDAELRYELLAEPSSERRSRRVLCELSRLDQIVSMVNKQSTDHWKNGITWN